MKHALLLLAALAGSGSALAAASPPPYRITDKIAGPDGGWDYARVDSRTHQLYVARAREVTVIDTRTHKMIGSLGVIAHGHSAVPVSDDRLLVTSGDDASVRFLQRANGKQLARLTVGLKPDAAILSHDGKRAFVMNATSGTISVVDVQSMKIERTIKAKPGLEYAVLDRTGTMFVNNEDFSEIELLDTITGKMGQSIPLPGCEGPSGLALDGKSTRLIAACANGKAAIVDARSRRLVKLVDIGRGPDAVLIYETHRLAFIPCGKDGVLDIFSLEGPEVRRIGRVETEIGARTGAIDPATGTIYLPVANMVSPPSGSGPLQPMPGSFHVLVISRRQIAG